MGGTARRSHARQGSRAEGIQHGEKSPRDHDVRDGSVCLPIGEYLYGKSMGNPLEIYGKSIGNLWEIWLKIQCL